MKTVLAPRQITLVPLDHLDGKIAELEKACFPLLESREYGVVVDASLQRAYQLRAKSRRRGYATDEWCNIIDALACFISTCKGESTG